MSICVADTPADAVVDAAAVCGVPQIAAPIMAKLDDPSTATTRHARFLRQLPMTIPPSSGRTASQPPRG